MCLQPSIASIDSILNLKNVLVRELLVPARSSELLHENPASNTFWKQNMVIIIGNVIFEMIS